MRADGRAAASASVVKIERLITAGEHESGEEKLLGLLIAKTRTTLEIDKPRFAEYAPEILPDRVFPYNRLLVLGGSTAKELQTTRRWI